MIDQYGLQGKVLVLVTDSASNMLKAFNAGFALPAPTEDYPASSTSGYEDPDDADDSVSKRVKLFAL